MEMTKTEAKGFIAMAAGLASYMMGRITELVIILGCLMAIDYATGVTAAFIQKRLESRKSLIGIIKKVCYMILLALAFFVDYIITYLIEKAGVQSPINGLFGIATTLWLIGTEGLSVFENLNIIGVPFPSFLKSAFKKFQNEAETMCTKKEGD